VLGEGTTLGHCKPVTWLGEQLQKVVFSAGLNLSAEEAWQLEKLMLAFQAVFTAMSNKHGWTNSISMSAMPI
jgi:hypothetical protein